MKRSDFYTSLHQRSLDFIISTYALQSFFEQYKNEEKRLQLKRDILQDWDTAFSFCKRRTKYAEAPDTTRLIVSEDEKRIVIETDERVLMAYDEDTTSPTFYCYDNTYRKHVFEKPYSIMSRLSTWRTEEKKGTTITNLPKDILQKILLLCSIWDLRHAQLVCNKLYHAAKEDHLWKDRWSHVFDAPIERYKDLPQRTQFAQYNLLGCTGKLVIPGFARRAGHWLANPDNHMYLEKMAWGDPYRGMQCRVKIMYAEIVEEKSIPGSRKRPRQSYQYIQGRAPDGRKKKKMLAAVYSIYSVHEIENVENFTCHGFITSNGKLKWSNHRGTGLYTGDVDNIVNNIFVKRFVWPANE